MARGKKAHMTLTAAQHKALMKVLGGEGLGDIHELSDVKLFVEPGHFGGSHHLIGRRQPPKILTNAARRVSRVGGLCIRGKYRGFTATARVQCRYPLPPSQLCLVTGGGNCRLGMRIESRAYSLWVWW